MRDHRAVLAQQAQWGPLDLRGQTEIQDQLDQQDQMATPDPLVRMVKVGH